MTITERRRAVAEALPLRPRDFFVLLVLAGGELHGYGIMKGVERESRGSVRLEVGSLYRTLDRLLAAGLIAEAGADSAAAAAKGATAATAPTAADSERRRPYRLTSFGSRVMRAEAERLQEVVRMVQAKGLLGGAGEP
ncbi:MAG TPA: helix-turn-helix transcriptional regulator [Thermoanaerobaculia bacterium]|nr:helix-turn-helix transcriptional regulator [Thermoanaerobaculia bacterium]